MVTVHTVETREVTDASKLVLIPTLSILMQFRVPCLGNDATHRELSLLI